MENASRRSHKDTIDETELTIEMTENQIKTRYNLHNSSVRLPHKRSPTTLSAITGKKYSLFSR